MSISSACGGGNAHGSCLKCIQPIQFAFFLNGILENPANMRIVKTVFRFDCH